MNVYKVYGNYSKREFLVSAQDQWKAVEQVCELLKNKGFDEEDIDEAEFQTDDHFFIDASQPSVMEL